MSHLRTATFYPQYGIVRMWISPNCCGERACYSIEDAKRLIKDSGVAQKLETEK